MDYEPMRQMGMAFARTGVEHGMDPTVVAQTIVHIATVARPHLRYRVGLTAGMLITLKRLLPEPVFEWIRRRAFPAEAHGILPATPSG